MERETIQITLPTCKATVTLYSFVSYGESRKIQKALMSAISINPNNPGEEMGNIPGSVLAEQSDLIMNILVKSIHREDGIAVENIEEFIFALRNEDGLFLQAEIEKISSASIVSKEDKKK